MACTPEMEALIHRVLDGDASEEEQQELRRHRKGCAECERMYEELSVIEHRFQSLKMEQPPAHFTNKVMENLPDHQGGGTLKNKSGKSRWKRWMQTHPFITAAAFFIVLMAGYLFSSWENPGFQAQVKGEGTVIKQGSDTAYVPEGEVISGDLIVKNGKVKIDGEVNGDVILINSENLQASAGHVTGDIKEIDRIFGWLWMHIKETFNFIQPVLVSGH